MRREDEVLKTGLTCEQAHSRRHRSEPAVRAMVWATILVVLVAVTVLALAASGALAAVPQVTLDGDPHSNAVAAGTNITSITVPHTTGTGDNRLMLVGVSWNSGTPEVTIDSVTFSYGAGPTVLTLDPVISRKNASNSRYSAIYSLLAPPSGETGTVTVKFTAAVANGIVAGAANFAGVNQTTPLGTPNGGDGTSSTQPSVTFSGLAGDELVFDNAFLGAGSASYVLTVGPNQTQLWNPAYVANLRGAASIEQATTSSVTMSWGANTASYWVLVAVPINPAPAGPTHDLTMAVNPGGGGTTDPADGATHTYPENEIVNVTATPNVGYVFSGWTGGVADRTTPPPRSPWTGTRPSPPTSPRRTTS